jgi:hypothetical protein
MRVAYLLLIAMLTGCASVASNYRISGSIDNGKEAFTGPFQSRGDDVGDFQVRTAKGRTCTGEVPLPFNGKVLRPKIIRGTISCDDGQSGFFDLQFDHGNGGNGTGVIGSHPFTFVISR